jgi:hypothetical protein
MLEINGKVYARVTEVIQWHLKKDEIPDYIKERRDRKGLIGTEVHAAIAEYIRGGFPIMGEESEPYFESFLKWEEAIKPEFLETEQRYTSDFLRLTGQIDGLIKMSTLADPYLIDFKTSAQEGSVAWPMQGHLYGELMKENGVQVASRYLFVMLDKKGKLPGVYKYDFDPQILEESLIAVEYFWENEKKRDCHK